VRETDLVWYVAYGSNLLRERFLAYLTGGSGPGGSGDHAGANDPTPPRGDQPVEMDRRLIFTGQSQRWNGGGVCAVVPTGPSDVGDSCLGRGWLITAGQLRDVWRQENGGRTPPPVSWPDLAGAGFHDMPEGRYRRLDWLGRIDDIPAVTITCDDVMLDQLNEPTFDYLVMVGCGVMQSWSLSPADTTDYLASVTAAVRTEMRARLIAELT